MTAWRSCAIGDLGRVITGSTPPAKHPGWFGDDTAFITPSDIAADARRARPQRKLSREGLQGLRNRLLPAGSVCFVSIGATIGKLCLTEFGSITNQQLNSVVPHPGIDGRFLYYLLRHDAERIASTAGGAATPILNKSAFAATLVHVPDSSTQETIGRLLGVIDDLIENSRRRIELLEQISQAIYREWFVHFRYPGHEEATDTSLVDSPLGPIPEGWQVKPLVSVASLTMGQSPLSKYYNSEGSGKPFHQGVTDFGEHFPSNRKYCSVDGRRAIAGDILISVRAPVGRLNIASNDMIIGRGLASARSMTGRQALLFRSLKDVVFAEEDAMGGGTIFKAVGKEELEQISLICAPAELEAEAETALGNNLALIRTLTSANQALADVRDLLLPKLVTGQIDVSKIDLDALTESVA